jgi:hypothetical protein
MQEFTWRGTNVNSFLHLRWDLLRIHHVHRLQSRSYLLNQLLNAVLIFDLFSKPPYSTYSQTPMIWLLVSMIAKPRTGSRLSWSILQGGMRWECGNNDKVDSRSVRVKCLAKILENG